MSDIVANMSDNEESLMNENRWMWYYLRKYVKYERCNICNERCIITHYFHMIKHVLNSHPNKHNKTSGLPFFTTEKNDIKSNEFKIWVEEQLSLIMNCGTCKQFEKFDIFKLMIHLFEVHHVMVPQKFIPTRLSTTLYNLFHRDENTVDISTSSSNQQPTCSTSKIDVENFGSDLNPDRTVESIKEE